MLRHTCRDTVRARYRLVREKLGLNHFRLVLGASMGGMHTWMWRYTCPGFMPPALDAADQNLDDWIGKCLARTDANDLLYAFEASRDYDPSPRRERIEAPLAAVNSAGDAVNRPEPGILEREIRRVKRGRFVLLPVTGQAHGHGTHSAPAV